MYSCILHAFTRNQFLLTLWDDFGEIEEAKLEAQMGKGKEFPTILALVIKVCVAYIVSKSHFFVPYTITQSFHLYKFILANQIQLHDTHKVYLSASIKVDQLVLTFYYTSLALACHKSIFRIFFLS